MKPLRLDLEEQEKTREELTEGLEVHNGIAIPRHMSRPGQDGYRTPTVHDYERQKMEDEGKELSISGARTPPPSAGIFNIPSVAHLAHLGKFELTLERLHWRERIRHYTWTFFTMTMATGGIANVLYTVPFRFRGLDTIGVIFFLFNMALFVLNVSMISLRFYTFPETFRASYMHPSERLFLPAWSTQSFTVEQMTPIWIFPAYPLLIIGPHASILCKTLSPEKAVDIIIGGFTLQGIGFLVAFMIYASYIYRLMTQKLPQESSRPGMFVSVGPSGFTVAGVIGMADSLSRNVGPDFMGDGKLASMILKVVANWMCLWIWGLSLWFFFVSVGAHWSCARQKGGFAFNMTWFSFVFPNSALITGTFAVGKAFDSYAIQVTGCVMTGFLIIAWFMVFGIMIRAIRLKQILWPQKGEDKDEGGFKAPEMTRRESLRKKLSRTIFPVDYIDLVLLCLLLVHRPVYLLVLKVMEVVTLPRDVPMGADPMGVAYNPPRPAAAPVRLNSAEQTTLIAKQAFVNQGTTVGIGSSSLRRQPRVNRSRSSVRKEPYIDTDTSLADQRGHKTQFTCRTALELAPPDSTPLVASQSPEDITESTTSKRVAVRDIEVEDIDQTPWQEYEIPSELETLQLHVPQTIRNIVQESLDEQRAMRLSRLQTPAIITETAITTEQIKDAEEEFVVAESSAMASARLFETSLFGSGPGSAHPLPHYASNHGLSNICRPLKATAAGENSPRSSEESLNHGSNTARKRAQQGRPKLTKAYGLLRKLRRPKDAVPATEDEQEPETYECISCFDDIPSTEAITVPCRHQYCTPCFSQLISTALQNETQFPPKCCLQEIPRRVLRNHLPAEALAYTCGARWRTCACTEQDQSRRARRIRKNLEKLRAEAQKEEEEMRAAIAAVEEAERQAAEERREEERRQEEARVEEARLMALREAERVAEITRHFNHLREILENVRVRQSDALAKRQEAEMQEIERKDLTLEASLTAAANNDAENVRARRANFSPAKLDELKRKHATELIQTRLRHRKDEDECLGKITTEQNTTTNDLTTLLNNLLSAQESELTTLHSMQARKIEKWKRREAMYSVLEGEEVRKGKVKRERAYEEGRREVEREVREVRRRQWAEGKWAALLAEERVRMVGEDEGRAVRSGGDVGEGIVGGEGEGGGFVVGGYLGRYISGWIT
ncbi:MAG: hypothetical protein Q9219_005204 [cf. Caloplaca sp. 3 TL-2023]